METYEIIIGTPALIAGITAAREAFNATLDEDATILITNEEYVQFVMTSAATSYAKQYGTES